jgi:SulP family sulfate permease
MTAHLAGDVRGGLSAAMVALAQALALGVLVYAGLGAGQVDLGVRAAFGSAVWAALVAGAVGGYRGTGAVPRTAPALILASLVATVPVDRPEAVLLLAGVTVAAAGVLQIVLAVSRVARLITFVPFPVTAGFMTGVGVLIVLAQVPSLLGLAGRPRGAALVAALPAIQPATLVVGLLAAGVVWLGGSRLRRVPAVFAAIVGGTLVFELLALAGVAAGLRVGETGPVLAAPTVLAPLATPAGLELLGAHWRQVAGTAFALGVIGALDSLLGLAAADVAQNTRHSPTRILLGVGAGNVVAGLVGGIPVAFSSSLAMAGYRAGARTARAGVVGCALLGVALAGAGALVARIPLAVFGGVMLTVGVGLLDRWSLGLLRRSGRASLASETRWTLAVVGLVSLVTIVFDFVIAVVFGIFAALVLFIAAMNRSLVRASSTGLERASRRVYAPAHAAVLREHGASIRVLELEGALFFGTVARLVDEVEALAAHARVVILDLRRIGAVDATGAVMLEQLARRLARSGVHLFLAHVTADSRHGRALRDHGTFLGEPRPDWLEDVDRALEAAEAVLLAAKLPGSDAGAVPLEASTLLGGLDAAQRARLRQHLTTRVLAAGETLFHEGTPGDHLYVLTEGSVSILTRVDGGTQRIVTFEPGVIFGEMAMLDGAPRSASAVADRRAVVHALSADALAALRRSDPELATAVLLNIARHLSGRLRLTTDALRSASEGAR